MGSKRKAAQQQASPEAQEEQQEQTQEASAQAQQEEQQEEQQAKPGTESTEEARSESGAEEVDERMREIQEQGFFGEKVDPYDNDEYTATGNQGRQAHEDRAKRVNPEGTGASVKERLGL